MSTDYLKVHPKGVDLFLWVQPGAKKSEIRGLHDGRVKIFLAAKPVEGAANKELVRFVASFFEISRSSVVLISGLKSRKKVVRLVNSRVDSLVNNPANSDRNFVAKLQSKIRILVEDQ